MKGAAQMKDHSTMKGCLQASFIPSSFLLLEAVDVSSFSFSATVPFFLFDIVDQFRCSMQLDIVMDVRM